MADRPNADRAPDADEMHEDVSYRAGLLMGRRQALNTVSDLLAANSAKDIRAAMAEWCAQTEHELDIELVLLVREHGHEHP
jgi:hypothetical protein